VFAISLLGSSPRGLSVARQIGTCDQSERFRRTTDAAKAPAFSVFCRRQESTMPKKHGLKSEFVMFDVLYEDGTQTSNRKVPRALLGGLDGDEPARGFIIEQDRDIAEKRGLPPTPIKSLCRSDAKEKERVALGFE
jgi:hypothetical protein